MSLHSDTGATQITKLDGTNYRYWRIQIAAQLMARELFTYVTGIDERPQPSEVIDDPEASAGSVRAARTKYKTEYSAWKKKDQLAASTILVNLEQGPMNYLEDPLQADSKTIWNKLEDLYGKKASPVAVFQLTRQLTNLKHTDGASMSDHLSTFAGIINQMAEAGSTLTESQKCFALLATLPTNGNWSIIVTSLAQLGDNLDMRTVLSRLSTEHARLHPAMPVSTNSTDATLPPFQRG